MSRMPIMAHCVRTGIFQLYGSWRDTWRRTTGAKICAKTYQLRKVGVDEETTDGRGRLLRDVQGVGGLHHAETGATEELGEEPVDPVLG